MSGDEKDELIEAQKQVIGILFEAVKRMQANSDLDTEYLQMAAEPDQYKNKARMDEILRRRNENSRIVGRLLDQLQS